MSKIQNIKERIVTYYNDLIKNNVITGKAPVTLEWMKRQRILEGRDELDIRFGHVVVDRIIGKKTPLAKAEQYLNEVRNNHKYELLPEIAKLLAKEYNTIVQPEYPSRDPYSEVNYRLLIPYQHFPSIISFTYGPTISYSFVYIEDIIFINNFILEHNNFYDDNYSTVILYIYIRELFYITLVDYFNEIRNKVESIIKQD